MFKSRYLNEVYDKVSKCYAHQKEFLQAVEEFFESMELIVEQDPNIEKFSVLERLVVPERVVSFRVSWTDDNGKIHVNNGYRIQFNSAIGPYKGGIRFDPSVNESIMKFLGFEQTFKNSLTGLPMGGAKGGADFDPRGRSDREVMTFCQSFIAELARHIGPDRDVPAGDLGVGAREIGFMYGMYKKMHNEFTGTFTGKGISYGGSLGRKEATGYGLLYFVQEMFKAFRKDTLAGKRVIVSGSGKVAKHAAVKAKALGARIVAMSDINGFIHDPEGLDVDLIDKLSEPKGECTLEYKRMHPHVEFNANPKNMWFTPCDVALPCATQNEIYLEHAEALVKNGCYLVAEGANMPTTLDATKYFIDHGVLFAPGKAANAGGVAVSGLEMSQNAQHISWTFEEVDEKLKVIMANIFQKCHETAGKYGQPTNLVLGANIAGFLKVYDALIAQGTI
ncbi:MAG TPA: NADP-specific glutamate dehydrogenase [Bacilli bacterium]|nr:NADP-specific glutamate dehydrogenase [Bacilli bacterium]